MNLLSDSKITLPQPQAGPDFSNPYASALNDALYVVVAIVIVVMILAIACWAARVFSFLSGYRDSPPWLFGWAKTNPRWNSNVVRRVEEKSSVSAPPKPSAVLLHDEWLESVLKETSARDEAWVRRGAEEELRIIWAPPPEPDKLSSEDSESA